MPDSKTIRLDFILSAKDEMSKVMRHARRTAEEELKSLSKVGARQYAGYTAQPALMNFGAAARTPLRAVDRSGDEQAIRDAMAGRIRGMREQTRRAQFSEEVNRRMFGESAAPAAERPGLSAADFGRGSARSAAGRSGRTPEEQNWYKALKSQTEGLEKMSKVVRGVGALAIVGEVGRMFQALPEAQKKYYENLQTGMTRTQAFASAVADAVPVVGELARGFQGLWTALTTSADEVKAQAKKEQLNENKAIRESLRDANNRRRGVLMGEADATSKAALRQSEVDTARNDVERGQIAARHRYEDEIAAANDLAGRAGTMGKTEDQDRVRAAAQNRRIAAEQSYRKQLDDIQAAEREKVFEAEAKAEEEKRRAKEEAAAEAKQAEEKRRDEAARAEKEMKEKARDQAQTALADVREGLNRARQYQSGVPEAVRGEMGALQGIIGSRGAADPAIAQAQKTANAAEAALKKHDKQIAATQDLGKLLQRLVDNMRVLPA